MQQTSPSSVLTNVQMLLTVDRKVCSVLKKRWMVCEKVLHRVSSLLLPPFKKEKKRQVWCYYFPCFSPLCNYNYLHIFSSVSFKQQLVPLCSFLKLPPFDTVFQYSARFFFFTSFFPQGWVGFTGNNKLCISQLCFMIFD